MKYLKLFLTILLAIQQCNSFLKCEAFGRRSGDGFVKVRGTRFVLNGSPYYANGFNAYWLMYMASDPSQRYLVSNVFRQASSHSLSVARTWAFNDGGDRALQISPGSYNEHVFQGLDFVIAEARKYGIKLILSFVNNYESMGGKKQYVNWGRSHGQYLSSDDDFFKNPVVKGFYKNHITTVLNRRNTINGVVYKNDPTIMAWELMNEPRCTSDPSGRTIQGWISEMAAHVKSIDRNHLLEAGLEGFYGSSHPEKLHLNPNFNIGTDFIANNQVSGIDFATIHAYPDQWLSNKNAESELNFVNNWLTSHIEDAQNILRKPLLLAEFGKSDKDSGFSTYQRDQLFTTVYNKIYASAKRGGAAGGALFWQLITEGVEAYGDSYAIVLSRNPSTANVIAQQSRKLYLIRKIFARMRNVRLWKKAREIRNRINAKRV
ncbi:mannan endo-1,4-beta-mannosidase 7 [Amaranthus tricolor]|uniref:mannan endo-1,4-beta-mannosidase 7 n=1 Tax=Amaranthus tricolor TaxID=29722 RepID=UPI002585DC8D|nr:mannan endo-1,4-beta-mannosidase 7 [Amaranthus tricolor]